MRNLTTLLRESLLSKRVGVLHSKSEAGTARMIGTLKEVGDDFIILTVGSTDQIIHLPHVVTVEPKE